MRARQIGINAVFNVIRQSLSIIFPLITYPYALKVLGTVCIGKVNYATSIVNFFGLFAMLGIPNYVIREGSRKKRIKRSLIILFQKYIL